MAALMAAACVAGPWALAGAGGLAWAGRGKGKAADPVSETRAEKPDRAAGAAADFPACRLTPPEQRRRLEELRETVAKKVVGTRDLEDGIVLIFDGKEKPEAILMEFIRFERECCPGMDFRLDLPPNEGRVTLTLRGSPAIRDAWKEAFAE